MWWRVTCPAPYQAARAGSCICSVTQSFIHIGKNKIAHTQRGKERQQSMNPRLAEKNTLMQDIHEGALIKAAALDKESGSESNLT